MAVTKKGWKEEKRGKAAEERQEGTSEAFIVALTQSGIIIMIRDSLSLSVLALLFFSLDHSYLDRSKWQRRGRRRGERKIERKGGGESDSLPRYVVAGLSAHSSHLLRGL